MRRVALHLAKDDAAELLRRLCLIVLEDAVAHPALPALVWLMAAQAKGYALTAAHVQLCLTVVYEVLHHVNPLLISRDCAGPMS